MVVNGHVLPQIDNANLGYKYLEGILLFQNRRDGTFREVAGEHGAALSVPRSSRGAAFGDFDNDGDLDILVNNNGEPPQLLRNDGGNANHWLEILLIGTRSNRDGVGARVTLTAGDLKMYGQRKGGMSYQAAQDPRLHFGLGHRTKIDSLEILWPSGALTRLSHPPADRILAIQEGEGVVDRPFPRVVFR